MPYRAIYAAALVICGLVIWHIGTGSSFPLLLCLVLFFGFLTWGLWLALVHKKIIYKSHFLSRAEDPKTFRFLFYLYALNWLLILVLLLFGTKYVLAHPFEPGLRPIDIIYLGGGALGALVSWLYIRRKRASAQHPG